MERFVLTDAQCAKMEPRCLGKPADPGRSGSDNRLFVEAVLSIVRTGSPGPDLPAFFGKWNTRLQAIPGLGESRYFLRLFEACSDEPDMEYATVAATISRSIATARAQMGDSEPGHRPLQGRPSTKIVALTDALGNLVGFVLLRGHRFDTVGVPPFIDGLSFGALTADKAFDSDALIADLNNRRTKVVISQHPRRAQKVPIGAELYKWRHLIENLFAKLKEFKRIAMRAKKTDESFRAIIYLAAAVINSQ
jgi:transposase